MNNKRYFQSRRLQVKAILILTITSILTQSYAYAQLPSDVSALMNKKGKLSSTINGKAVADEDGSDCEVIVNPYSAEEDDSIQMSSRAYFNVTADLLGAKKETSFDGTIVYVTKAHGKRAGGSVCGDTMPLLGYKKTVETKRNKLTIRETFRCLLSKYEIIQACTIAK